MLSAVPTLPRIKKHKTGEDLLVVPAAVCARLAEFPLVSGLFLRAGGYFPRAATLYRTRPHGLRDFLLIYCVSGRAWFEIQGRRQVLHPDDVLILPPGLPHRYGPDQGDPWTIHWAAFNGTNAMEYLRQMPANRHAFRVDPEVGPEVCRLFENLHTLLSNELSMARLLCASKMLEHVLGLLFFHTPPGDKIAGTAADALATAIQYMRKRLDRSVKLAELAQAAHLSFTHLSRLFKLRTGASPIDYFIRLKMQAACQELMTTDRPVKAIASDLGYLDCGYFSRVFRKVMGSSPNQYRKS
jgi:AraC family transcriptional regulator, arabinose operon regulatory protein